MAQKSHDNVSAPPAAASASAASAQDASSERRDESRVVDFNGAHAAILTETLKLADSLLRQAARDIEATLFERVFDRLRTALPELVDRALHEHSAAEESKAKPADPRE
jgi:Zn-dependent M32 family carboxypeptidase